MVNGLSSSAKTGTVPFRSICQAVLRVTRLSKFLFHQMAKIIVTGKIFRQLGALICRKKNYLEFFNIIVSSLGRYHRYIRYISPNWEGPLRVTDRLIEIVQYGCCNRPWPRQPLIVAT
jgi:hypothetical protein